MKKLSILFVLVLFVLTLNGFGPKTKTLNLTDNNNGQILRVKQNQIIKISLDSNITTGYSWKLTKLNEYVLKKIGKLTYIRPLYINNSEAYKPSMPWIKRHNVKRISGIGTPGQQVLTLLSDHKGLSTIKLIYKRQWEKSVKPVKTFKITIIVD